MKKCICLFILIIILVPLTSCTMLTGRSEELVDVYNKKVENTLSLYKEIENKSNEESKEIFLFLSGKVPTYKDKNYNLNNICSEVGEDYLIQKNKLFTSSDSNYVKQIILIYNNSKQYYFELFWTVDGVESITGRVI